MILPDERTALDVPWEILREVYHLHFGNLVATAAEKDLRRFGLPWATDRKAESVSRMAKGEGLTEITLDELEAAEMAYCALTFEGSAAAPARTRATFGAARFTGGHEIFWAPIVQLGWMSEVLRRLVMLHAPLYPGKVIRQPMMDTVFQAVLLAPAEGGSISLGHGGGVERFALRVVPLTEAEHQLARGPHAAMARLLDLLRANGALDVVDPLRDCVLEPESSQEQKALLLPFLLEQEELRLHKREQRLRRMLKAGMPPFMLSDIRKCVVDSEHFVAYLRPKRLDPASPAAVRAEQTRKLHDAIEQALDGVRRLVADGMVPAPVVTPSREVAVIALSTHPVAAPLLHIVAGLDTAPAFDPEVVLKKVAAWICFFRPDSDQASLLGAGRLALEATLAEAGPGAIVPPHVVWKAMVSAMCRYGIYYPDERDLLVWVTMPSGIRIANEILTGDDSRPPLECLRAAAKAIVGRMAHLAKAALRNAERRSSPSPRRRAAPKKPTLH